MSSRERLVGLLRAAARPFRRAGSWLAGRMATRGGRRLLAIAVGLLVLGLMLLKGTHRVREGEVGVFVNNLTGTLEIEPNPGVRVTLPWVWSLHRLNRKVQSLLMVDQPSQGFRGGDAVKIKTSDGSSVSLDIMVTYRLLPEQADTVLREAGPAFGDLWVRSSARAAVAVEFGKLTSEQLYDAAIRDRQATEVVGGLNQRLGKRGVEIVAVVPRDFRFYKEYEEIIRQKKLADQEVEEQQAQARLAQQEQSNKVGQAQISARAKVLQARAEAERLLAESEGYAAQTRLDAEGNLLRDEKRAAGLLATGMAEAQGLREAAQAIAGEGGINLVALEYAKKLGLIQFTGVPVMQDGRIGQYRIHQVPPQDTGACAGGVCGGPQ